SSRQTPPIGRCLPADLLTADGEPSISHGGSRSRCRNSLTPHESHDWQNRPGVRFCQSAYVRVMAKPRNRIRTNDPVVLRNRLLDAAAGAFQSAGYGATSIHDLLRATGVTGGALHHHLP